MEWSTVLDGHARVGDIAARPDGSVVAIGEYFGSLRAGDQEIDGSGARTFVVELAADGQVLSLFDAGDAVNWNGTPCRGGCGHIAIDERGEAVYGNSSDATRLHGLEICGGERVELIGRPQTSRINDVELVVDGVPIWQASVHGEPKLACHDDRWMIASIKDEHGHLTVETPDKLGSDSSIASTSSLFGFAISKKIRVGSTQFVSVFDRELNHETRVSMQLGAMASSATSFWYAAETASVHVMDGDESRLELVLDAQDVRIVDVSAIAESGAHIVAAGRYDRKNRVGDGAFIAALVL